MKINENTTSEEVKQKTKETLMQLCNAFGSTNDEQQVFDELSTNENDFNLNEESIKRIIGLKQQIEVSYAPITISPEEIIEFLKDAINYNEWAFLACDENWSIGEKIEYFLHETPDDDIMRIFDAEINSKKKYPDGIYSFGNKTNIESQNLNQEKSNKTLTRELEEKQS